MKSIQNNEFQLRMVLILLSLSSGVMYFFMPLYSKEINMNVVEISGLFSITTCILILLKPVIGKLIDQIGRKPILSLGILCYAISYFVFSMTTTSTLMYIGRMIQGVAGALTGISIYAIVADTHDNNHISKGFGSVNSAQNTGNIYGCVLAFIVFSMISFKTGWKVLFIIFGIAALVAMVKVIISFQECNCTYVSKKVHIKRCLKSNYKLLSIVFITSFASSMVSPIIIIYLQDTITTDLAGLGLAFFPALFVGSLLSVKIGAVSDKLGKKKAMVIGMIISGITYIILPSATSVLLFTLIWTMSSMGGTLYDLSESGLYAKFNKEDGNGKIFGVYTLVSDIGSMIGPIVGGILYYSFSESLPFYLYGIITFVVALLIPWLLKSYEVSPE